jgi:hypothetical protein
MYALDKVKLPALRPVIAALGVLAISVAAALVFASAAAAQTPADIQYGSPTSVAPPPEGGTPVAGAEEEGAAPASPEGGAPGASEGSVLGASEGAEAGAAQGAASVASSEEGTGNGMASEEAGGTGGAVGTVLPATGGPLPFFVLAAVALIGAGLLVARTARRAR